MKNKDQSIEELTSQIEQLQTRVRELENMKTGKQRARHIIQESKELYKALVEISPEAIALLDLSGSIIMVNQQAVEIYGASCTEELIGKNGFEIIVPEDRERARKNAEKTLQAPLREVVYEVVGMDNRRLVVEINSLSIKDEQNNTVAVMLVLRDVTEKKVAECALKKSELNYRTLSEGAISGVYIIQNNKFYYVNPALSAMFGYTQDEIINNLTPALLIYPADSDYVARQLKKHFNGEVSSSQYTFRGLRKDGTIIYCESLTRLIQIDGKPAIVGTLLDISERKKAEEELLYKEGFKNIISDLSAKLINLNFEDLDKGINDALKQIGEFTGIDRSYIFLFCDGLLMVKNTHEWCALGIQPQISRLKKISTKSLPWLTNQIKKAQTVHVPCVADLPRQAQAEKNKWQAEGIRSLINVPMLYQGQPMGFLGVESVKEEKVWPEDIQSLLRAAANMMANVIKRIQMGRDMKALNKELLKTNMKLKQLALRDSLTNLYNHRYFAEAIEAEFMRAKRHCLPLSVIMLDVDYFKSINDVYGHQFGDLVLKQLAGQLTLMVRKYDTVIRFGGEEFIIITPGAGKEIALILAQRLLEVIKLNTFGNKSHNVKLKLSVSVACFPEDKIHNGSDFIKISEYILNKAKETGGDRVYSSDNVGNGKLFEPNTTEREEDIKGLKDKLDKLTKRANQSLAEAIFAFAKTIDIKDHYTGEHVEKTVHYAMRIAQEKKLPGDEIERIRQAAILHDLGKLGISERILLKKKGLTPKEYAQVKKHPQIGADILRPIHFFHAIIPFILHHHERWDGKGYPFGLKGEEIPLGARIIALADTYEALTSDRHYRKACSQKEAIAKIKKVSGTQLDPEIVKVFLDIIIKEKK
ncbi:MAG: diguanylate cyclase [Candidatus Omnitrophica bacterium]|nr:diguanylate cyclase [Candidatus Omnitrophota bacterium]